MVVGAGSAGVRAARFAANYGARVAVVEAGPLGGTCVNAGCIPKKLLSYAAHFPDDFGDAAGFGYTVAPAAFDWRALIAAKDAEIARLNNVYGEILSGAGVTIIHGRARLIDGHTVAVDGPGQAQELAARHVLIATGGRAVRPPLPGAELGIVSDDAFHLTALPRRVVVYGGGYIAVEFASIFRGLGAEVTLAYRGERLLREFDFELGQHLAEAMAGRGVDIRLSTSIAALERTRAIQVRWASGAADEVDCVLFATGRVPNTVGLGLEEAGIATGSFGAITVDAQFRTSQPSVYAIGDVIARVQLTPVALAEGMLVADHLFGPAERRLSYANIPTAVFSHPNVASVGLSEQAAIASGHTVTVYKSRFRPLKSTLGGGSERVLVKIVVDDQTDRVLGFHMVGPDAGEVIQGFAVALNAGLTKAGLDATIGIHPTLAEEFVTLRNATPK